MSRLPPPYHFHLDAAVGWIMLGKPEEAEKELQSIPPPHSQHPDVLETFWSLLSDQCQWSKCLRVAEQLITKSPDRPSGWVQRAYALRRVEGGGLQIAWDALRPAAEKFPDEPLIPYNLSCYACQLEHRTDALRWLQRALDCASSPGGQRRILAMAAEDPDLGPIRAELPTLKTKTPGAEDNPG